MKQWRSDEIYSSAILRAYDLWVLGVSNRWAWRCPTRRLLDAYNRHVGDRHLEVGVGTGYFIDRCAFPHGSPTRLTLVDRNPSCLAWAGRRVGRHAPQAVPADALQPMPDEVRQGEPFDSAALNYLLHCLPGPMPAKAAAVRHAAACVKPGGVVFGATILGQGVRHNAFGRRLMRTYNRRGVFGNEHDDASDLETALADHLDGITIEIVGVVALFAGRTAGLA